MSTLKVGGIRGVSASSDAITVANDGTCTANITNNLSNRNKVINGAALVAQRGTISDHGTSVKYTAVDRFCTRIGTSFNFDITSSQSTDAPAGFANSLKLSPDSTQTPTGSANGGIQTKLEGQDLQDFAFGTSSAKPMTLSFYAKSGSAGAGTYSIEMQWVSSGGTLYQQTRAFTITSSFQRFTFTFEANGDSTSVAMKNDNTDAVRIIWHLASGPDDQTSAITTWTSTSAMKTITGMDNFMSSTSNEFYITGVQLEVGEHATDFEHRTYAQELELCKRYFFMIGKDSFRNDNRMSFPFINEAPSNTGGYIDFRFHPEMRATPTATIGSSLQLGRPQVDMSSHTVSSFNNMGPAGCHFFQYNNQTGSTGDADKYLRAGFHTNAFAEFSAEL